MNATQRCTLAALLRYLQPAQAQTFVTWAPWESDSMLAAWVLKRHVYPDAGFESLPKGTPLPPERALDTPDSPYRRTATSTAFEATVNRTLATLLTAGLLLGSVATARSDES